MDALPASCVSAVIFSSFITLLSTQIKDRLLKEAKSVPASNTPDIVRKALREKQLKHNGMCTALEVIVLLSWLCSPQTIDGDKSVGQMSPVVWGQ